MNLFPELQTVEIALEVRDVSPAHKYIHCDVCGDFFPIKGVCAHCAIVAGQSWDCIGMALLERNASWDNRPIDPDRIVWRA